MLNPKKNFSFFSRAIFISNLDLAFLHCHWLRLWNLLLQMFVWLPINGSSDFRSEKNGFVLIQSPKYDVFQKIDPTLEISFSEENIKSHKIIYCERRFYPFSILKKMKHSQNRCSQYIFLVFKNLNANITKTIKISKKVKKIMCSDKNIKNEKNIGRVAIIWFFIRISMQFYLGHIFGILWSQSTGYWGYHNNVLGNYSDIEKNGGNYFNKCFISISLTFLYSNKFFISISVGRALFRYLLYFDIDSQKLVKLYFDKSFISISALFRYPK